MGRAESDEAYVIDLCDEVLGIKGACGDPSPKTGGRAKLPVDAYWESPGLVVEYAERQHTEAVAFFDKPDALTVSGVHRGERVGSTTSGPCPPWSAIWAR